MKQALREFVRQSKYLLAIGTLLCASMASLLPALTASAQAEATGIAITPPLFELSANPGDTIQHSIRVDNFTSATLPLVIDRKDFVPLGEEGQATLSEKPTNYSLSTWIKPETSSLEIAAKGSKTVTFKIEVPANAEPGGHFGSIVFRTTPQPDGANTIVSQEIGALVLLKIAGNAKEKASIASFSATKNLWQHGPIDFETRFKNEGNVQARPTGTITITNIFGKKVGSVSVASRTVLPESVRKMRGSWQGSSWPGWYTATASVNYGSKNQILTSSTKFIIFPYKVIVPLLIVVVVLGVLIFRARKRLGRSLRILFGKE